MSLFLKELFWTPLRSALPPRIDVEDRQRRLARGEGLHRQPPHHRTVLADRIHHHRILGLGRALPHDVNAFRLQVLESRNTSMSSQKISKYYINFLRI
jgi:hypothetical protein